MIPEYMINEMVAGLNKFGVFGEEWTHHRKVIAECLKSYWDDKIISLWTLEDFRTTWDLRFPDEPLLDEQLLEIMEVVNSEWDANEGINYHFITSKMEEWKNKNEITKV